MKRDNMSESHSTTNLIINNIPASASDDQLNDLFCKFGSIKSYKVIRHNDKDGKTYGFCEYMDAKCATQALKQLDNYRLNERILRVSYAKLFPKPKGKSVGVGNIPKYMNEDVIRKYFSQFGRITRMRLKSSDGGCDNKLAEIIYDNKADAGKACYENERTIQYESKTIQVSVYMIQEENDAGLRKGQKRDYGSNYYENDSMHQQQSIYDMNYLCMLKAASSMQPMSQTGGILQHSQGPNITGIPHSGISPNTAYSSPYAFDMNALQAALIYQQNPAAFCHNPAVAGIHNGGPAALQYAAPQQFSPGYYSFPAGGLQGPALPLAAVPHHQQYMTWATGPQTQVPSGGTHYYSQPQPHQLEHGSAQVIGGGGSSGSSTTVNTGSNGGNSSNSSSHTGAANAAGYYGPTISTQAALQQAASIYQQQNPHLQAPPHQHHMYQAQTNNMGSSVGANNNRNSYYKPPSVASGPHIGNGTIGSSGIPSGNIIAPNQVVSGTSRPSSNSPPIQRQQSTNDNSSIQQHVVYVYNIGNNTDREQLKDLFRSFVNDIIKIDIPRETCMNSTLNGSGIMGGNNKNFCFITFSNFQAAESAITDMNGAEFQGKILQVSFKK